MMGRAVAVWGMVAAGALATVIAAVRPLGGDTRETPAADQPPASPTDGPYAADSLVRAIVTRDVFRAARRPATVAYDPTRGVVPEAPAPPKPALTLVGLVAGEPPSAVIEGFAGVEGSRVVRPGDVVAGLRVTSIKRDAVTIVGLDTTWVLRVREPWKP